MGDDPAGSQSARRYWLLGERQREGEGAVVKPSQAQQRIVDYLESRDTDDFVYVPPGVCGDVRSFDALDKKGVIEGEWRPASLPPGSFEMVYRIARGES